MGNFSKILKIVALLIVVAGSLLAILFGTQYLRPSVEQQTNDSTRNISVEKEKSETQYNHARTSNGPLTRTIEITLNTINDKNAFATITLDQAKEVKQNQSVILFNESNTKETTFAKVSSIKNKNITITYPQKLNSKTLSTTAQIIISQTRSSHRLPVAIIQYDINDAPYIWLSEKTARPNEFKAVKQALIDFRLGDRFFEPNIDKKAYRHYILNPDKHLKDGNTYTMNKVKVKAPLYPPLKQAEYDKKIEKIRAQREKNKARISNCGAGGNNQPNAPTKEKAACKGNAADLSPMEILNNILQRR